ncbi:CHAT domain-containing protein [Anabaena sp. CCY 0017]|uniref:CHAT domain-containing protein n=1 Tax=Anabaena sp. CCY 0017 TaxID=3103866 RepID=UPI0039C62B56
MTNSQRPNDRLNLLNTVFECTNDQELINLLRAKSDLVDAEFLQIVEHATEIAAQQGEESIVIFLRSVAAQIKLVIHKPDSTQITTETLNFFFELLQINWGYQNEEKILQTQTHLTDNLDKLNDQFSQIIDIGSAGALSSVDPDQAVSFALSILNFSDVMKNFYLGSRATNLEIAISGYQKSLQVFTLDTFPEYWATIQHNLGTAYLERIRGDRFNNIELAIICFQNALNIYNLEDFSQHWAMSYHNLALAYSERILGERADNLELAIKYYHLVLQVRNRDTYPEDWAKTQMNLGATYNERIQGVRSENLELAIACYQNALQVRTEKNDPEKWANVQTNLGNAYSNRIFGKKAENLELAIVCHENALQVFTLETFPEKWAIAQTNLGNAYSERIQGVRIENLETAITCYQNALLVYGNIAWQIYGLKLALEWESYSLIKYVCSELKSSQIHTQIVFSEKWAMIQLNLAKSYLYRILGDKTENLQLSIIYGHNALKVFTKEGFPEKWAKIQMNLASAYILHSMREYKDNVDNLELAITCIQEALDIHTEDSFPEMWATNQQNLGSAYLHRIQGKRIENIEQAINCYLQSLKIRKRETLPNDWANTQINLAAAYREQMIYRNNIENLELAITSCKNALDIFTCEAFPERYAGILFNLGLVYQDAQKWLDAYTSFATAINTVESIRGDIIFGDEVKQKHAEDWVTLYKSMIEVCLELANQEPYYQAKGLEYLERYKARNLVERMANYSFSEKSKLEKLSPISFAEIQELLPDEQTVIIEWCFLTKSSLAFIITKNNQYPLAWKYDFLNPIDDELMNSAFDYLFDYYDQEKKWTENINSYLHCLGKYLKLDEILVDFPENCSKIILIPHLFLHSIPLHAIPLSNGTCLLDRFSRGVSYAPSCQILQQAQNRKRAHFNNLFAISNPTQSNAKENRLYTEVAIEVIRHQFNRANILSNQTATKEAINNIHAEELNSAHCIIFGCHGIFNLELPFASGLFLANDQILTVSEIFDLHLQECRLVTLMACETGLIDYTSLSDEYIGLSSAFLYAGANTVVSSFWQVSQGASAFLMIKFYENLQTQSNIALALQEAQIWLRDVTNKQIKQWLKPKKSIIRNILQEKWFDLLKLFHEDENAQPFKSPYYWAAFCTIGQS